MQVSSRLVVVVRRMMRLDENARRLKTNGIALVDDPFLRRLGRIWGSCTLSVSW